MLAGLLFFVFIEFFLTKACICGDIFLTFM